ncbi:putative tetratricopeptide-like helical domain superfamily [Helianthus annuus]|uniref:Putative tetratricopeptide-like helical domain-containing protein n=1 Tax=Helianthus annuus TaxID=4232 RepID=A0A251UKC7_HELAN|nr:pentatricopeptide repeat-containing protein At1g61870, mitochondrial [Helianthus annuus]KAF5804130.1 putative tetratricopeptide-like helical domain superfamily [Helianthus annuus]KAJ0583077.1 putative tetratricopeptide-like helical domain superfamily [Helianthus annuus]
MASIIKLRQLNTFDRLHFTSSHHFQPRHFSSILNPDSNTPLSSKDKSRAALTLLKTEKNPQRITEICRAASLTPESHLDRLAFSIAISKLTGLKYFDGIHNFIQELLQTRPDLKNEKFIAHAIIYYGQAGLLDHAFQLFDKMPQLGVDQNAKSLNALLFSCMLAKRYDEAKRVYLEFPGRYGVKINLDTYNTVIKSFCESGLSGSSFSVIAEMVRKNCKPNATTFGTLIAGFYKEEKFEEVGKVLEMMRKYEVPIGIATYNTRIQSLCKLKKTEEANELLDGLLLSGMKPNSVTYCHLIHGYCKEGKLDEAKNLFNKMINSGFKPNSDCYFTLISYMCKAGDFEAALTVCKQSMEKDWVPNFSTMKLLVAGLANSSKVQEARELVEQIKERFPKNLQTWNEIEEHLSKSVDT